MTGHPSLCLLLQIGCEMETNLESARICNQDIKWLQWVALSSRISNGLHQFFPSENVLKTFWKEAFFSSTKAKTSLFSLSLFDRGGDTFLQKNTLKIETVCWGSNHGLANVTWSQECQNTRHPLSLSLEGVTGICSIHFHPKIYSLLNLKWAIKIFLF